MSRLHSPKSFSRKGTVGFFLSILNDHPKRDLSYSQCKKGSFRIYIVG